VGCNTILTAIEGLSCGLKGLINLRSRYVAGGKGGGNELIWEFTMSQNIWDGTKE
jgi:hypothetical protein